MALTSKSEWAQLQVGLMAIVALVILAFLIFLMTGSHGLVQEQSRRLHLSGRFGGHRRGRAGAAERDQRRAGDERSTFPDRPSRAAS